MRRAERPKEQERKKKAVQKKRKEAEKKGRAAREAMGIGLATRFAGFSHTQQRMKSAMEGFESAGKLRVWEAENLAREDEAQEEQLHGHWDQETVENETLLGAPANLSARAVRQAEAEVVTARTATTWTTTHC